jgi:hypothetical protein
LALLAGATADAAKTATLEIAREIAHAELDPILGPSKIIDLAHGKAGRALFFANLARATGDTSYAVRSTELLDEAIDGIADTQLFPGMLFGFTGIAWVHQHLGADPEVLDTIDEALLEHVSIDPWTGRCDYALGLAGYGVYLLSRPSSQVVDAALDRIERHLVATAASDSQRAWWPPPSFVTHEIDMLTGMAGIASYLATAWPRLGASARALLPKALNWIWADLHDRVWARPVDRPAWWCHCVVAFAALRGARRLDDATWWERGLAIARRIPEASLPDASFYYGAAGVAHMFHRIYRATGDAAIGDTARAWFERVLAMRVPGTGIAGYRALAPGDDQWTAYPGVTMGVAGIGLVLLAGWSDVAPSWDAVFQLEIP